MTEPWVSSYQALQQQTPFYLQVHGVHRGAKMKGHLLSEHRQGTPHGLEADLRHLVHQQPKGYDSETSESH